MRFHRAPKCAVMSRASLPQCGFPGLIGYRLRGRSRCATRYGDKTRPGDKGTDRLALWRNGHRADTGLKQQTGKAASVKDTSLPAIAESGVLSKDRCKLCKPDFARLARTWLEWRKVVCNYFRAQPRSTDRTSGHLPRFGCAPQGDAKEGELIETPAEILSHHATKEAANSFIAWRKQRKKPLTETAAVRLATALSQITASGGDADDALGMAEERGWLTIRPDWYFKEVRNEQRSHDLGRNPSANATSRAIAFAAGFARSPGRNCF